MIRLTVPTLYNASYVLPKKRTENDVTMTGSVDIQLRVADDSDAPVVHVIGDTYRPRPIYDGEDARRYNPFPVTEHGPCVVRSIDGRLFARRVQAIDGPGMANVLVAAGLFNVDYKDARGRVVMGTRRSSSDREVFSSRAEAESHVGLGFRKWDDQYDRTSAAIQRRCEDIAVVDGWVYEAVGEPVISVQRHEDGVVVVLGQASAPLAPYGRGNDLSRMYDPIRFGIDQLPRALETADRLARAAGQTVTNHARIEMVSPWAVRYRGEREHMLSVAFDVIKWGRQRLTSLPAAAGLAWHDLASSISDVDQVNARVVDALRRIDSLRLIADAEADRYDGDGLPGAEHYALAERERMDRETLDEVSLALDLWDTRENRGIEWVGSGLDASATFEDDLIAYEILSLHQAERIGARLGRSLDDLAAEAAAGRGHLVAVENASGIAAVSFVSRGESGPEISETVTGHGTKPSGAVRGIALRHVSEAGVHGSEIDAALDDLGI